MLAETAAAAAVDADAAAAAVDKLASLSTAEKKRPRTTRQATETQPVLFTADASLAAALEAVPADDWGRNWAPCRTMMLRRTSKRVKGAVDKLRLPAVVRVCAFDFSPAFEWLHGPQSGSMQNPLVWSLLASVTAQVRISTLDLRHFDMTGPFPESLPKVLAQCPALTRLILGRNNIGARGAQRLAGALVQCTALAYLDLRNARIRAGAQSIAGALAQCTALAHLDLEGNFIGAVGAESLAGVLAQCSLLAHLNLRCNCIEAAGAESLGRVLWHCPALAHLNLDDNEIGPDGVGRLAEGLAQCTALDHLILANNGIETTGAESLARVLGQFPALVHLETYGAHRDY